jgi:hypothetical protein
MKYAVEMVSGGGDTDTQHGALISLLLFFKIDSVLKIFISLGNMIFV